MDNFLDKVRRTIDEQELLDPGDGVVAAVSGGADSVAMLLALNLLREELGIDLRVLHVNHGLRGEESDRDEALVAETAGRLGIPGEAVRIDLKAEAGEDKRSLQELAREVRYRKLEEAAERWGFSRIAVGHNADDQVETILENLLRGSGIDGLSGIPYKRGRIIRPLLEVPRREIEEFLGREQVNFCVDSSNLKTVYLRNRVRLELVPLLKQYNPNLTATLHRTAAALREDASLLEQLTRSAVSGMGIIVDEGSIRIPVAELLSQPLALQRRIVRLALQRMAGGAPGGSFQQVSRLLELATSQESGRVAHLSRGLQGRREYGWLVLERRGPQLDGGHWEYELSIPGRTVLPEAGGVIEAEIIERDLHPGGGGIIGKAMGQAGGRDRVALDLDRIRLPVYARRRRPGDRFYPLGLGGSQKVKEFFIDRKVSREMRDKTPVVGAGEDIYWLAGCRADARFAADCQTRRFLIFSYLTK